MARDQMSSSDPARLEAVQAHGRLHHVEFTDVLQPFHGSALDVRELHVAHPGVEKALVHRVDNVVHDLQPVAVLHVLGPDFQPEPRPVENVVHGKRGRFSGGPM